MSNASLILQLIEKKQLVSSEQVEALRHSSSKEYDDDGLVDQLTRKGFVKHKEIIDLLADEFAMTSVDLSETDLSADPNEWFDESLARRYGAYPIGFLNGSVRIAISDPLDVESVDSLGHILRHPIEAVLADPAQIEKVIELRYRGEGGDGLGLEEEVIAQVDKLASESVTLKHEGLDEDDAPIIRLVQVIIADAVRMRASDIHLEPLEERFRLRYRIDGVLEEAPNPPPKRLQLPIISRIKVMGKMSIAEKRLPQDGRIQVRVDDTDYDLRVSSLPTAYGESIVMRILDKSGLMLGMPELGFLSDDQEVFENLITLPDGIVLVTGPTGSGKTTTLYSCLNYINKPDRKIITVEDPIEYQMSGINQVPVNRKTGMTFAAALKSMLRQAPNIIMIGEIRDKETAEIAINASLTGHMVFSTLHTNDAPSAVTRLVDIGVKPYLVATSLRAALAQRLVRRLCPSCKTGYEPSRHEINALGLDPTSVGGANFMRGVGCPACYGNGVKGRFGIFEIFLIKEEIERAIYTGASAAQLRLMAKEMGMRSMRDDGVRKVIGGLTSVEEVLSVTVAEPIMI